MPDLSEPSTLVLLASTIFFLAILYSAVGHAGASGYLAALAIVTELSPEQMKGLALILNVFVGAIGSWHFLRAGHFRWRLFWPLGLTAMPMAFLGGLWQTPPTIFRPLIGIVLLYAAIMLLVRVWKGDSRDQIPPLGERRSPRTIWILVTGAVLGFLAGATGTGGGIFLSPLLLFTGWATARETAAVTIVFVFTNSLAGLGGVMTQVPTLPDGVTWLILSATLGGILGARLGSRHLPGEWIRVVLALVLIIAAGKMFLTAGGRAGSDTQKETPPPVEVMALKLLRLDSNQQPSG